LFVSVKSSVCLIEDVISSFNEGVTVSSSFDSAYPVPSSSL
jgi:hypothetical protein